MPNPIDSFLSNFRLNRKLNAEVTSLQMEKKMLEHRLIKESQVLPAQDSNILEISLIDRGEVRIPYSPRGLQQLYDLSVSSPILRTCVTNIRDEIFRRGGEWEPEYEAKCGTCGKEYDNIPELGVCSEEGCFGELIEPDETIRDEVKDFLFGLTNGSGNVNKLGQTLFDVFRQIEDDLNVCDDSYMLLLKDYTIDKTSGEIMDVELKQVVRGGPQFIHEITRKTGELGGKYWICAIHRDNQIQDVDKAKKNRCPICGGKYYDVKYVSTNADSTPVGYFIEGEVLHVSKYSPGYRLHHGFPPVLTVWKQAMTLMYMEDYSMSAYSYKRKPNGMIAFATRNQEALSSFWGGILEKLKTDKFFIPVIAVDPEGGGNKCEYIDFMDSLKDMEYIAARDEMRNRISAFYGVSNIFMGDTSTSGGLNNEGLQIVVTNRAVERGQRIYNEILLPAILDVLDAEGWRYTLLPSEEKDEMAELQRMQLEIQNAQSMRFMGFDITLNEQKTGFEYGGEASEVQQIGEFNQNNQGSNEESNEKPDNHTSGMPDKVTKHWGGRGKHQWSRRI